MSEWKETTLGEIADIIMGQSPTGETCNNNGQGLPLLNGPTEFGDRNPLPTQFTIDPKKIAEAGDLLFCVRGSTTGRMNWADQKYAIGRGIASIRAKEGILFQPYIRAIIEKELKSLLAVATGSTFPNISKDHLLNLIVQLPPNNIKIYISNLARILDEKIYNLRSQNETLEAIAQTLFKHWFIDFEFPNADGKPYKSSGGAMVRSELGDIPEGWRVGKLGDIGKNIREGVKENDIKPDMSYIGLEHLPRKQIALDTWGQALDIASNKFWFNKGNILFGKLRPYFHKVGVAFTSGVCSTDILVIDSKQETYFCFLLMLLSSEQFIYYVSLASEGTRMPRTSWEYMKDYPIVIPKSLVLEDFNKLLNLLIKKMEVNIFQIQTLTKTHDTLLPKLMSGQLRVKE